MLSYNNNYLWFEFIGMKNHPIYLWSKYKYWLRLARLFSISELVNYSCHSIFESSRKIEQLFYSMFPYYYLQSDIFKSAFLIEKNTKIYNFNKVICQKIIILFYFFCFWIQTMEHEQALFSWDTKAIPD